MRPLKVTLAYLLAGDVSLRQVTTASFMPALLVGALIWFHPRRTAARIHEAASPEAVSLAVPR